MADGISQAECRKYQGECRKEMLDGVMGMIDEVKESIAALAATVANMAGDIRVIKDRLGINGSGEVHPHHRATDPPVAHEHKRKTDTVIGLLREFKWYILVFGIACAYAGKEIVPMLEKLLLGK